MAERGSLETTPTAIGLTYPMKCGWHTLEQPGKPAEPGALRAQRIPPLHAENTLDRNSGDCRRVFSVP